MRHLRPLYDVHRFRLPPQLEAVLDDAAMSGQLNYKASHIDTVTGNDDGITVAYRNRHSTTLEQETFDTVINCTGPESRPDRTDNPFIRALVARGLARIHPAGGGFDVDNDCAAVDANGESDPRLRVFGPLTLGQFGDPQGTPFILRYIVKTMPRIIDLLEAD